MAFNFRTGEWQSDGSSVYLKIEPFFNIGFLLRNLRLHEEAGGNLSTGSISLESNNPNDDEKLISTFNYIIIYIRDELITNTYDIFGIITKKSYTAGHLMLNFKILPKTGRTFNTLPRTRKFNNINQAIKILYPYMDQTSSTEGGFGRNIKCKSDVDLIDIYLAGETDYSILTKLAHGYKKQSIFGYGLDGFFIKDIKIPIMDDRREPNILVLDKEASPITPIKINYEPKLYLKVINLPNESKHLGSSMIGLSYFMYNKSNLTLMNNYIFNDNYLKTKLYSSFDIYLSDSLPKYRLGDTIAYFNTLETGDSSKRNLFMVTSNDFYFSDSTETDQYGKRCSVVTTLRGIEDIDQNSNYQNNSELEETQLIKLKT